MIDAAKRLIKSHDLQAHPEGGFYRETFRSELRINTAFGQRNSSTAILYLLSGSDVSRFHRIDADEVWHFHEGGALAIYSLLLDGSTRVDVLGPDNPQVVITAGVWFGAALVKPDGYGFVGCTVSPGFEFSGFELAEPEILLAGWPTARDWIERLT